MTEIRTYSKNQMNFGLASITKYLETSMTTQMRSFNSANWDILSHLLPINLRNNLQRQVNTGLSSVKRTILHIITIKIYCTYWVILDVYNYDSFINKLVSEISENFASTAQKSPRYCDKGSKQIKQ